MLIQNFYKYLLILILIGSSSVINAAHLIGTEGHYECLGSNQYKIYFSLYMEPSGLNSGNSAIDQNLVIAIWDLDNTLFPQETKTLTRISNNDITTSYENVCSGDVFEDVMEKWDFEETITLAPNSNGYKITYWRCCRPNGLMNVDDYSGLAIELTIPPSSISCNNSPQFNSDPIKLLCLNEPFSIDLSATDIDGDDLVYKIVAPYSAGTSTSTNESDNDFATFEPPFNSVTYKPGFSGSDPFGNGNIQIDNQGNLTGLVNQIGNYFVVGIEVEEWRNGTLIGSIRRDIPVAVVDCGRLSAEVEDSITATEKSCTPTITFDNASVNSTTAQWDFGVAGITSDQSTDFDPTYTFPDSGTYNITLIATHINYPACKDTAYTTVTILKEPEAEFTSSGTCNSNKVIFENTGTLHASNTGAVIWQFTGIDSGSGNIDSFVYSTSGNYDVSMILTDSFGCADTIQKSITVGGSSSNLSLAKNTNDSICAGDSVVFTASGGTQYTFYRDNIEVASTATFEAKNIYNGEIFTLISDTSGACSDTIYDTIYHAPNPIISVQADSVCYGSNGRLIASGTDLTSISWTHTNSTNFEITEPNITEASWFYFTGRSVYGCQSSDSVLLSLHDSTDVSAGNDQQICAGSNTNLAPILYSSNSIVSWNWDNANNVESPVVSPTSDTKYILTATDSKGCTDTASVWVRIGDFIPNIQDKVIRACQGAAVNFLATNGSNHRWSDEQGNLLSTSAELNITAQESTTYFLLADDNTGICTDGADTVLLFVNIPYSIEDKEDIIFCENQSFTIQGSNGHDNCLWTRDGVLISTDSIIAIDSLNDWQELFVYTINDTGCNQTLIDSIWIQNMEINEAIPIVASTDPNDKYTYEFTADLDGAHFYIWNINQEFAGNEEALAYTFETGGNHQIELAITNEFGCSRNETTNIFIDEELILNLPNAFTPNNDAQQLNEVFRAIGSFSSLESFEMQIFDRWGNIVFKTQDHLDGWNGDDNNGNPANQGMYTYAILYKRIGELQRKSLVGSVLLIR